MKSRLWPGNVVDVVWVMQWAFSVQHSPLCFLCAVLCIVCAGLTKVQLFNEHIDQHFLHLHFPHTEREREREREEEERRGKKYEETKSFGKALVAPFF